MEILVQYMIVCISPTKVSHKNKISVKSGNPSVAASIKKSPFYTMAKSILKETVQSWNKKGEYKNSCCIIWLMKSQPKMNKLHGIMFIEIPNQLHLLTVIYEDLYMPLCIPESCWQSNVQNDMQYSILLIA